MYRTTLQYLVDQSAAGGTSEITRACRQFLKLAKAKRVGITPTNRRTIPESWVNKAWRAQSGICPRCNEPVELQEAVGDHRIAIILGGEHSPENTDATHPRCNLQKSGRDLLEDCTKTGDTVLQRLQRSGRRWPSRKFPSRKKKSS